MAFDTPTQDTVDPNVPDWTEDSDSPQTATGADSITVSIGDPSDVNWCYVKASDNNSSADNADVQVNGDSGSNYKAVNQAGTTSNGNTSFPNVVPFVGNAEVVFVFQLNTARSGVGLRSLVADSAAGATVAGVNQAVSGQLNQFTISRGASTDFTVEVFGRDVTT